MELTKEMLQQLAEPFPPAAISIKVQTKPNEKGNSLCVAYIDARDVMDRLDQVVGGEWSDDYRSAPAGGLECSLTVCGVTRRDVGDTDNDNETEKSGYSDAFKRAAVKFGIGRFLYSLPKMYGKSKAIGKGVYLQDGEEARLRSIIAAHLSGKSPAADAERKTAAPKQQPAPAEMPAITPDELTLEQAEALTNSKGDYYGSIDTETLAHIANNAKTPPLKKRAAELIMASRNQ